MKTLFVLVTVVAAANAEQLRTSESDRTHSAPSSVGALMLDKAANPCLITGTEVEEGNKLMTAGRLIESRAKLESALAQERAGAADPIRQACLMNTIGFVELQQRRAEIALEWFQRALELKPLSDALLARLTGNVASAYTDLMQLDTAEGLAHRAVELSARAFGADHPETLFPQTTLAFIHVARGEYARAEPVLRRILYRSERSWGPSSYEAAQAAGNLAFVYFAQARHSLARELFEKALAGLEKNPIRAQDEIPLTQANLAISYAAGGRSRDAQMWLERALAQAQRDLSPDNAAWPVILERVAIARFFLRDYESGRQMFDRAITLLEARYGPGSPQVQIAFERYSAVLRKAKDKTGARMLEARRKAFASGH